MKSLGFYPLARCFVAMSVFLSVGADAIYAAPSGIPSANQMVFRTPDEASAALGEALKTSDVDALRRIFGVPKGETLVSGDNVADRNSLARFNKNFNEKYEWEKLNDDYAGLSVGNEGWPLPFPLVRTVRGWEFDYPSGKEEINNRRVGENELHAISVCREFVRAQEEYFSRDPDGDGHHEYAQLFLSSRGFRNGLFWAHRAGERPSPLGAVAAQAFAEGYRVDPTKDTPSAYHGYYFRILKEQGSAAPGGAQKYLSSGGRLTEGFALVAYPSRWGYSGIMSFLIGKDGVVYEKNLGTKSIEIGSTLRAYNPDSSWKKLDEGSE